MWIILEPVIFALIGTEIQIDKIDPSTIGYGTIVLVGALLIRLHNYCAAPHNTQNLTSSTQKISGFLSLHERL